MSQFISEQQQAEFIRDGYIILPKLVSVDSLNTLKMTIDRHLQQRMQPYELETELCYPGAPSNINATGGDTIRRLLNAYERDPEFTKWASNAVILGAVRQLLNIDSVLLNPNHHNCIMTKQPRYSSRTHWHRDTRYWHFNNKYLVNAWLAVGDEKAENGGMLILPGSHRWDVDNDALDEAQFLIEDHPSNKARLSLAKQVNLNAGDCLLFSAHCFHAAGKNTTDNEKYSLVFTYHGENTRPLENTKSSKLPPITLSS